MMRNHGGAGNNHEACDRRCRCGGRNGGLRPGHSGRLSLASCDFALCRGERIAGCVTIALAESQPIHRAKPVASWPDAQRERAGAAACDHGLRSQRGPARAPGRN